MIQANCLTHYEMLENETPHLVFPNWGCFLLILCNKIAKMLRGLVIYVIYISNILFERRVLSLNASISHVHAIKAAGRLHIILLDLSTFVTEKTEVCLAS